MIALLLVLACSTDDVLVRPDPTWERMQRQDKVDPYEGSKLHEDGMAMRTPPEGTVHWEAALDAPPKPPTTLALLTRGQDRYRRFCSPCHGVDGDARTPVARAMALREPPALTSAEIRALDDAHIHGVISEGYGLMPSYAGELVPDDRWAVVAYVRALQLASGTSLASLPADVATQARRELP